VLSSKFNSTGNLKTILCRYARLYFGNRLEMDAYAAVPVTYWHSIHSYGRREEGEGNQKKREKKGKEKKRKT
jgi:hypothetical protein